MQVNEGLKDLVEEALCLLLGEWLIPVLSHVLFQVKLQVLEDKIELLLGINDLLQFDDVWMFKSFEEGDFSDGSRRHSIILFLQSDFLQGHDLARLQVLALIHDTISALTELLHILVALELVRVLHKLLRLFWLGLFHNLLLLI